MTETYTIRPATPADSPVIVTHRRRMFEDMGHTNHAMMDAADPLFHHWLLERLENGRYLGWLAVEPGGAVVGGAGLWLLDWPPGLFDIAPYRGYILNVYTNPQHRKQGLARRVVGAAVEWCAERKIRVISLHASDQGRPVYEAMDFKPTNEMRLILPEDV
jgi:GNAT superfamily N-acetyltransferase